MNRSTLILKQTQNLINLMMLSKIFLRCVTSSTRILTDSNFIFAISLIKIFWSENHCSCFYWLHKKTVVCQYECTIFCKPNIHIYRDGPWHVQKIKVIISQTYENRQNLKWNFLNWNSVFQSYCLLVLSKLSLNLSFKSKVILEIVILRYRLHQIINIFCS